MRPSTVFWIILVGGIALLFWPAAWPLHDPAAALAHALVIAGVLGITVDRVAKDHLLKEAARDISQYLIGYRLPEQIQDQDSPTDGNRPRQDELYLPLSIGTARGR